MAFSLRVEIMRVLLIEDDVMIGEAVLKYLRQEAYVVDWAHDVTEANLALDCEDYEIILLDLGLPDGSGLGVLTRLRKRGDKSSVIILTARDAVADRIAGLDGGADDYLVKPFDLDELNARMRAVQRRWQGRAETFLLHGDLRLNPVNHECLWKEQNVILSAKEFSLLQTLMEQPNAILSRAQLEESLYGWGDEIESNAVEVHIHNLRKKIATHVIKTIRGVGYVLGSAT